MTARRKQQPAKRKPGRPRADSNGAPHDPGHFGRTLTRLREQAGKSINGLAIELGVSASNLAKLERGTHRPSLTMALRLAHALGAGIEAFDPER